MSTTTRRATSLTLASALIATIAIANWAVATYGPVPVWSGLAAPAGVYAAGVAFTLRDLLHDIGGRWAVLATITVGAVVSLTIAPPALAVASAAAFTLSELADFAVYTPLRRRRWLTAVAASNIVGLIIDSIVFLWLAFGALTFLPGQIVGKTWMTIGAVAILAAARAVHRSRQSV